MALHNEIGEIGEKLAAEFLLSEGYQVLECNWRPKNSKAEVDIILKRKNCVVFVEVKTRTSEYFGEPEEYVRADKQKHLFEAAQCYLRETDILEYLDVRFDVVSVVLAKHTHKLVSYRHITNAFEQSPIFC